MNIDVIKKIRNTPITGEELVAMLGDYKSPTMKLSQMEKSGEVIRLKRGLYVIDGSVLGYPPSAPICSNHIYGPSYLSSHWELSYYGLIPERLYELTAVCFKRTRTFENRLGRFSYRQVPEDYYPIGIKTEKYDGMTFMVASPEKALCDLILTDSYVPCLSMAALHTYLEEDIRLDMDELGSFDVDILSLCAQCGRKSRTIENLIKIIKRYESV